MKYLADVPVLEDWIVDKLLASALDLTYAATQLHTTVEYYDEL